MKTLIFCTSFADHPQRWYDVYFQWRNAIKNSKLKFDKLLICDDHSKTLPLQWYDTRFLFEEDLPYHEYNEEYILYLFKKHLGRQGLYEYPGWYRSFIFAAQYAREYDYEKVIHIEADAYLISDKIQRFFNDFQEGWISLYCPKYQIPETAIQIIAGSALQKFYDLSKIPYERFLGKPADPREGSSWLPFKVYTDFKGDRWGEGNLPVPKDADFACQIGAGYEMEKRWWIKKS